MKSKKETITPEELLRELKTLVADAETMVADTASEHADEAIDSLRSRFTAAQDRFEEVFDGAKKKVAAGARHTDELIRANPYQSLAIAAGAGIVVGLLLGRRGK